MTVKPEPGNLEESYCDIKRMAVQTFHSCNNNEKSAILKHLKTKSEDIINSRRRFDEISDLESYIRVLENRGILNSENISEMVNIYTTLRLNVAILIAHTHKLNQDFEKRLGSSPTVSACGKH